MDMEITRSAGWDESTTMSYFRSQMVIMKNGQPYTEPINTAPPAPAPRVQKVDEDGNIITSLKSLRRNMERGEVSSTSQPVNPANYDPDAIDPNSFFNSGLNTLGNQLGNLAK